MKTKHIILITLIIILFAFTPIIFYFKTFNENSLRTDDWSNFGSFVSGTTGIILVFFTLIFSIGSIYLSLKVSEKIQQNDFKFNEALHNKNLEVIYLQNKPFPSIELLQYREETSIELNNFGLGPLIIKSTQLVDKNGEKYNSIDKLLEKHYLKDNGVKLKNHTIIFFYSAEKHIIAPNTNKILLKIIPEKDLTEMYFIQRDIVKEIIGNSSIEIIYEDLFGNSFNYNFNFKFFLR